MNEEKLLEHFDNIFRTKVSKNINNNDMQILNLIYENFESELYVHSEEYEKLRKLNLEKLNNLEQELTYKQKQLLEEYSEVNNKMLSEEQKQLFIFGYLIASELNRETKING